jgi:hypothetical protein
MATKNGLVRVLVTRPTFTGASPAAAEDDAPVVAAVAADEVAAGGAVFDAAVGLFFELEQAEAKRAASATVDPTKTIRRR